MFVPAAPEYLVQNPRINTVPTESALLPNSRISRNSRSVPLETQSIVDVAPRGALASLHCSVASLRTCCEFAIFNFEGLGRTTG
jgi:hypothetical protein